MNPWTIWFKPVEADTWQPLELYRSLPTGHYRVAANLSRPYKRLDWRWKFYPQTGDPQYYDFQGYTNEEGLISLLDLNTLRPGTWQLIGRPDLFDELCGETWIIEHQFQIIPSLASALIIPPSIPDPVRDEPPMAANEIVPHPPEMAEVVVGDADANQPIEAPGSSGLDLIDITEPDSPLLEPAETAFRVLAEPDFVPEEEILTEANHFRPVNYVLQLVNPEKAETYQVDITLLLDDRRQSVSLDLPNPRQMVRLLHRPIPKPKSPLPPKLSKV